MASIGGQQHAKLLRPPRGGPGFACGARREGGNPGTAGSAALSSEPSNRKSTYGSLAKGRSLTFGDIQSSSY
eukprot:5429496-Alexandrium_andersonii.AAC.1